MFYYYYYLFFSQFLKLRNTVFGKKSSESRSIIQLTLMEEKALHFVSGYISYSLPKENKNIKESSTSKEILKVIESWQANREENLTDCGLVEYTKLINT